MLELFHGVTAAEVEPGAPEPLQFQLALEDFRELLWFSLRGVLVLK